MDQVTERRVFLWRSSDRRERPDGTVAVVDAIDLHHGKIVLEAVIAEMVSKWSLGLALVRIDRAADDEVGLGRHGQAAVGARPCATRRPPSAPANASSGRPSGRGMTAATVKAGGPPTKTLTRSRSPRRIAAAWCTPIPRWIW